VVLLIILVEDLIVHHLSQLAGNDFVEMKKSILLYSRGCHSSPICVEGDDEVLNQKLWKSQRWLRLNGGRDPSNSILQVTQSHW